MSSNTLLITVQQIKDRTALHSNVDEKMVKPDIKYAQDAYILPMLGTALMLKLQADIEADNVTGNYETLLNQYIVDALVYHTLAESPMTLSFQLYNKGAVRKTGIDTDTPNVNEVIQMSDKYRKRAEWYTQRLADYLLENHTLFPEYDTPGTGIDVFIPEVAQYNTPFYLGDDCKCTDGSFDVAPSKYKKGCR